MGLRAGAAALAVLLTAFALVKGPTASDYELWRARRLSREYEVWHWGGAGAARAAARVGELLELAEGKPVKLRDASAGLPAAAPPGTCPVAVGVASGEAWKALTGGIRELDERWKSVSATHPAFTGVSFFSQRGGAPILGVVALDEKALLAAAADASLPGAPPPVPDVARFEDLDESRFVEWSPLLPPKVDVNLGFVEYCVSQRDTSLEVLEKIHARVEEALKRFEAAAGPLPKNPGKIQVVLYNTLSEKRVNSGTTTAASVRFARGTVEAVYGNEMRAFDPADVLRIVQHRSFGLLPSLALEDGLPSWCAAPGELDAARALAAGGIAGSASDLTNALRRGPRSPLLLTALDRAVAGAALEAGPAGPWLRGEAPPPSAEILDKGFRELVKSTPAPASRPASRPALDGAWCGFELRASAGASWTDAGLNPSLSRARGLGATHVVMTTLRRPGERQGTFVKTGGPTDGEVAHVAAMARANGLGILLRTNVGGFRRGAWVGEPFKLKSRDWDDYFAELGEAWIHDAILASRYCDGWILGEALRGATGPPETVKYWRDWIGRLRRLESGPLGYVASWQPVPRWVEGAEAYGMQSELQRVAFWGDLDFVGVDMSAPLADGDTAALSPGVLASILDAAEATAATAGRPLALFEIGYPATSRAYETPWRRNGEPAVAPQDASYRLALEAVKSRRSVRAVVVSSWPVGAGVNPLGSDWFSPVGRPAEASVRALFEAIRSR